MPVRLLLLLLWCVLCAAVTTASVDTVGQQDAVRSMFSRAWDAFRRFSWGWDELLPCNGTGVDWLPGQGSLALSVVEGLDTAAIMGLHSQVRLSLDWIEEHLSFADKV